MKTIEKDAVKAKKIIQTLTKTKYAFGRLFMLLLALSLAFVACEGPAGPEGPQGPQGETGVVGPAGNDGSVMYAGEGAPAADIGANGDFYLNQTTGELYGPKDDSGWGTPISLQGPPGDDGEDGKDGENGDDGKDGADGKDGEDGSQMYAGTNAPKASLGQPGDYFLNTAAFDLYGPKTEDGWGTPINLKGTANVLYSSWIDIDWNIEDRTSSKIMSIPENRLTDEFLDTGVIKMYIKAEAEEDGLEVKLIVPLPGNVGSRYVDFFAVSYTGDDPDDDFPADFKGIFLNSDGELSAAGDEQVRYVLIPGGEQLSAKGTIDLDDYEQVKKYYGIQE